MSKFVIEGPTKLSGEIIVSGAKNAAMKMIAASVLIPEKVTLNNVPDILDVQMIIDILTKNGAKITRNGHSLEIDTANLSDANPDPRLIGKMRGAIVLIGPYLARFGKIATRQPGGCVIGARPIETHLDAFRQMGVEIKEPQEGHFILKNNGFNGSKVILSEASVTATENILMAAVKSSGQTIIENAALEPEIIDLAKFLMKAGAKIIGEGTSTIVIDGVQDLHSLSYDMMPDRIEAGTFLALSVVTKSPIAIVNCRPDHLKDYLDKMAELGVQMEIGNNYIETKSFDNLVAVDVKTDVYPGFATDLQAPMGLVLTQASGTSHLHETLFEHRLSYLEELEKMGAKVKIINSQEAEISGPSKLRGKSIEGPDLRAGATLVLAGLCASGKTTISNAEIVDRGYEALEKRLKNLGANIERID